MLRQHASGHAGEYIASSAFCHPGITRGVDPHCAVGGRNHSSVTFEYENAVVFPSETAGNADAVALDISNGRTDQTRHLTGMRREHERALLAIEFLRATFEGVQAFC